MGDIKPIPTIKPIINTLRETNIGYFLASKEFERFCVTIGFQDNWSHAYEFAKNKRSFVALSIDHKPFDCVDALVALLNTYFEKKLSSFYFLLYNVVAQYQNWPNREYEIDFISLKSDLEAIKADVEYINEILKLEKIELKDNIEQSVSENVWSASQLNGIVQNISKSIKSKNYNDALTHCYTALEGIFKIYLKTFKLDYKERSDIIQLSNLVKSHLKNTFNDLTFVSHNNSLNLLTTITHAIANCRNKSSSSHFGAEADLYSATFHRDNVHTVVNLLSKILEDFERRPSLEN